MEFYEDFDHIGYNLSGQKVAKPTQKDEVDRFLDKEDDPAFW
jgi:ribosome biogenesis protein ERB1